MTKMTSSSPETSNIIEIRNLKKVYRIGGEDTVALNNISLSIRRGEFVAIMGPSGSGKSTMMHILGLLDKPTNGDYRLNNTEVGKLSKGRQAEIRNQEIGFVFQQFNLLPRTSVLENVLLPTIYGRVENPKSHARELVKRVGLAEHINNKSNQLSGGQIQRVAIARALIMNPSIILADEPTGNLDSHRSAEIMRLFREINQAGATIVLITHDQNVARHANRILRIKDGQLETSEVLT